MPQLRAWGLGLHLDLFQNVLRDTCENECLSLGHEGFGYEYSSSGRCEVWKAHIERTKLEYVDGNDCYIRVNNKNQEEDIYKLQSQIYEWTFVPQSRL